MVLLAMGAGGGTSSDLAAGLLSLAVGVALGFYLRAFRRKLAAADGQSESRR